MQDELKEIEAKLEDNQKKPHHLQDHSMEQSLVTRYEQTMTKLNDFYIQRAKKHWVKDGDRNTAYFHMSVAKRRRNSIMSVKDENNLMQFMPDRIANTFVTYFRSIFASSNSDRSIPYDTFFPLIRMILLILFRIKKNFLILFLI